MSRRRLFAWVWAVVLMVPAVLEIAGLLSPGKWDMLSEHVIPLVLSHPGMWISTLLAWLTFSVWLTWHWWFQYKNERKE